MTSPAEIARENLRQVQRFEPRTDAERRLQATNVRQLERYLSRRKATG